MNESDLIEKCIKLIERVGNDSELLEIETQLEHVSLKETGAINDLTIHKYLYDEKKRQLFGKYDNVFESMDHAMTSMLHNEPYKILQPFLSIFDAEFLENTALDIIIEDLPFKDNIKLLSRNFFYTLFNSTIFVDKGIKSISLRNGKCKSSLKNRGKRNEIPIDFIMQWSINFANLDNIYYLDLANNSLVKEDLKFLKDLKVEVLNVSGNRILFEYRTEFYDCFVGVIEKVKTYVDFSSNFIDYDVDILKNIYLKEGLVKKYVWLNSGNLDSKDKSSLWVRFYNDNSLEDYIDIVFQSHVEYYSIISNIVY
eukprot:NODE_408_length_7975_cov_0.539487.p3 type:complete len:311 gc:universal NODE_408_length_7975_cov_0.539487:4396-3464(-)